MDLSGWCSGLRVLRNNKKHDINTAVTKEDSSLTTDDRQSEDMDTLRFEEETITTPKVNSRITLPCLRRNNRVPAINLGELRLTLPSTPGPDESTPSKTPDGRFIIDTTAEGRLGLGANGYCQRGWDTKLRMVVAVKVVVHNMDTYREAGILSKLNHPNIVKLIDVQNDDRYMYTVLEMCQGGELFHLVANAPESRLDETVGKPLLFQMFKALSYLQSMGISHCDIKPENLLMSKNNTLKIADFGLAKSRSDGGNAKGGSNRYAAPELYTDKPYDTLAADMWSAGIVLFAVLSGSFPFMEPTMACAMFKRLVYAGCVWEGGNVPPSDQQLGDEQHQPFTFPAHFSPDVCNLIAHLLRPIASERPNASQVLTHPFFADASPSLLTPFPCCTKRTKKSPVTPTTHRRDAPDESMPSPAKRPNNTDRAFGSLEAEAEEQKIA